MCEACGQATQVGHHWIEKSRSARLRYDTKNNIISLCNVCHGRIHNIFGNNIIGGIDVAQIIINKRGQEWHEAIKVTGREIIKVDRKYYEDALIRLQNEEENSTYR